MTDMTLQEALAEVGKWGRITKGFEKVAEAAGALASAEQLTAERQAKADGLLPLIKDREDLLAQRIAEVADAEAKAADIISAAAAKADEILAEARAAVKAEGELAGVELALKQSDLAEATSALAAIEAALVVAKAELEDVQKKAAAALEAARERFAI